MDIALLGSMVRIGMEHKKEFFDFSHAEEFGELTRVQDLSGKTDFQKYRIIYEKYQHCYGEDFLRADAIDYPSSAYWEEDPYTAVINRFRSEVCEVCGGESAVKEAKRDAYYGGLTDEQVRRAVIESYDTSEGITFRELYDISYDIWSVGLDGGFHFRLDDLFADDDISSGNCRREEILDAKVNAEVFDRMRCVYDSCMKNGTVMPQAYLDTLDALRECI